MGVVSLKVGVVKQKIFATLRAPNNANPPFQNPGSATALCVSNHHGSLYSAVISNPPHVYYIVLLQEL